MRYGLTLTLVLTLLTGAILAQSAHDLRRYGDEMYMSGQLESAEESYRKANSVEPTAETSHNLGNSIYYQERYDEAIKHYEDAVSATEDPEIKANAYHNLGNTHFNAQAFDKSIGAYMEALKLNPQDLDTKKNLTAALRMLQQQQQQQQQQQDQQQQEQEEQEQEEQQQQQQQQPQEQQSEEQEKQPQETPEDLSKKEAEELLKIIENEDQKVQERLRKASSNPKKNEKDW